VVLDRQLSAAQVGRCPPRPSTISSCVGPKDLRLKEIHMPRGNIAFSSSQLRGRSSEAGKSQKNGSARNSISLDDEAGNW
jgi:hypothetical protein